MLSSGVKTDNITDVIPAFLELRSSQKFYIHTQERIHNVLQAHFNICKTQVFQGKEFGKYFTVNQKMQDDRPLAE